MNFLQALVFCVMLADMAKFIYDVEKARGTVPPDGLEPVNRRLVEMTLRQL